MIEQEQTDLSKIFVQAKAIGCFSQDDAMIEIILNPDNFAQIFATVDSNPVFAGHKPQDEAIAFINDIFCAASRAEILTGGRMTTRYEATLVWNNYYANELGNDGRLEFVGSDITPEDAEIFLQTLTGERATNLREKLQSGLHCRPVAIFLITLKFLRRLS
jgi:hypothetical protein